MIPDIENQDLSEQAWQDSFACWLACYGDPAEKTILYRFVEWAARTEWAHRRTQRDYDLLLLTAEGKQHQNYQFAKRNLAMTGRLFKSDEITLKHFWKNHYKKADEGNRADGAKNRREVSAHPDFDVPTHRLLERLWALVLCIRDGSRKTGFTRAF